MYVLLFKKKVNSTHIRPRNEMFISTQTVRMLHLSVSNMFSMQESRLSSQKNVFMMV